MSHESLCPECEGSLVLDDPMVGEILPCPYCGVDLEVIALDPLQLDVAPEVEEDWGE